MLSLGKSVQMASVVRHKSLYIHSFIYPPCHPRKSGNDTLCKAVLDALHRKPSHKYKDDMKKELKKIPKFASEKAELVPFNRKSFRMEQTVVAKYNKSK